MTNSQFTLSCRVHCSPVIKTNRRGSKARKAKTRYEVVYVNTNVWPSSYYAIYQKFYKKESKKSFNKQKEFGSLKVFCLN